MKNRICLIGDVVIDITNRTSSSDLKMRLGGITHAARCLWSMNIPYDIGYFAPAYLDEQIEQYFRNLNCSKIKKLGNINGSPNLFLIQEPKEIGDQGYEFILKEELRIEYNFQEINSLSKEHYKSFLLISGSYNIEVFDFEKNQSVNIDLTNDVSNLNYLQKIENKLTTIFLSSSSIIFKSYFKDNFTSFIKIFEPYTDIIVLKENRGGSRGFDFRANEYFETGAQLRKISHSVGVGDAFDAAFISLNDDFSNEEKLSISSWVASEYATTSYPDDFKLAIKRLFNTDLRNLINIYGIILPWEVRSKINIYIAAPDFSFVDTKHIDILCEALSYHNFFPRRPVRENGQMEENATTTRRRELVEKDIKLLHECSLLIAILLYNDPGTLIELGYASAKGIPCAVYDPYNTAQNCMLLELPDLVTNDLSEIIDFTFKESARYQKNEK